MYINPVKHVMIVDSSNANASCTLYYLLYCILFNTTLIALILIVTITIFRIYIYTQYSGIQL